LPQGDFGVIHIRWTIRILPILASLVLTLHAQDDCAHKPQVLVLGTYHMANPGRDMYNMQVDDVRTPNRQRELAQLADVLAKYAPTKIAIEADPDDTRVPAAYKEYLAGKHELSQNEIEQIGFRLGKQLGHKELYPIDVSGEFPMERVMDYAKAKDRSPELEKMMSTAGPLVAEQDKYVKSHTVLQSLLYMNSPEAVAEDNNFYIQLAGFGEPGDFAGPDLLTDWYGRNIRIYSNLLKLIGGPTDRVLVIYGTGHLFWLRENVKMSPNLCLRTLSEFAPR
jgi:Family of unknown function (DUF5694)